MYRIAHGEQLQHAKNLIKELNRQLSENKKRQIYSSSSSSSSSSSASSSASSSSSSSSPTSSSSPSDLQSPLPTPQCSPAVHHNTPRSEAFSLAKQLNIPAKSETISKLLPYTVTLDRVRKSKSSIKIQLFSEDMSSKKRKRYKVCKFAKKIGLSHQYVLRKKVSSKVRKDRASLNRQHIVDFLCRQDNSYMMPDKKDQVRGKQIYCLADTMSNLHSKYIVEFPQVAVCKSTFCSTRPTNIRLTRYTQRKICLCEKHTNIVLRSEVSHKAPIN